MATREESFVNIGTAFDVPEEDAPKKKALPVHEQFATDTEGRRRFHGAFTGGFSAGYFNTVGSKEGWKPSAFVSSRANRFESSRQMPEDFMDEEDLGEFGIAPRNVETTKLFSQKREDKETQNAAPSTSAVTLESMMKSALEDLVVPCRMSIGIKLLKKMGWKEGQGIGPRVRQHSRKKVYGCVLPPGHAGKEKHEDEHDVYAEGLLFAPKDTKTVRFTPKDNLHGIGYKGMLAPTPLEITKPGFSGNLKIKGQAFGVGAFEDDDEDVYAQDSMSNYDIEIRDRKPSHSDRHGWTGPPRLAIKDGALSLFAKASKPKPANKVFPPPSIPRGYQPFVDVKGSCDVGKDETTEVKLTSDVRGELLGERPMAKKVESVFDLMSKSDRDRITSTKKTLQENFPQVKSFVPQQRTNARADGFQPFAKDPAKQARYDSFLEARKSGKESNGPNDLRFGLTEWEREREKEEFSRAAMLYRPMTGDIAARFTRGKNIDDDASNQSSSVNDETKSVEEKAAEMKMFGKLTRSTFEWHPAKLLCKRFNIPEPYPSSSKAGLVMEKKEKFSLAQLFETSLQKESDEASIIPKNLESSKAAAEPREKIAPQNLNTEKPTNPNTTSDATVSFEQKAMEKPSMDLFKAIFANSSEESEDSDNEEEKIANSIQINEPVTTVVLPTVPNQQTKPPDEKDKITHDDCNRYKTNVDTSSIQLVKIVCEDDNVKENAMEVEEEKQMYGPRLPPSQQSQKEDTNVKLTFQGRQNVPFSRYDSSSESDSDRQKRKYRKKHKSKQKNKDKSKKREKTRGVEPSSPKHCREQTDKSKQKEIPNDKQILSKLKAVQKRRMCAADFM